TFGLPAGGTASLSASGCTADLVVFNAAGAQVARGPGATTVTNTGVLAAVYRVALLRPYPGTAAPTSCTVAKNGAVLATDLPTGGRWIDLNQVAANDTFETVMLPNGAGPTHAMYLERGTGKLSRITTGGTGIGARAIAAAADAGERRVALGVPLEPLGLP